jgi:hypothetical protein
MLAERLLEIDLLKEVVAKKLDWQSPLDIPASGH